MVRVPHPSGEDVDSERLDEAAAMYRDRFPDFYRYILDGPVSAPADRDDLVDDMSAESCVEISGETERFFVNLGEALGMSVGNAVCVAVLCNDRVGVVALLCRN